MSDKYPRLKLPLQQDETPGEYMQRYLLQLSAKLNYPVSWSEVARHLDIPINTLLANKDGRPPRDFATVYTYSTFFGSELLKAYGISLKQLAYILASSDDPEVESIMGEIRNEARARRKEEPEGLARQNA
jgi:hypothetical protein